MAAAVELSDRFTGSVGSSLRLLSGASVVEIGAGRRQESPRPESGPVMAGGGGALGALTAGGLAAGVPCAGERAAGELEFAPLVANGSDACDPMPIGDPGTADDLFGDGAAAATEGIAR